MKKKIDWKALLKKLKTRFRNQFFWMGIGSIIALTSQTFGFDISSVPIIGNYEEVVNTIFVFLSAVGVAVNTSTPGARD